MQTTCTILQERSYNEALSKMILIAQRATFSGMPFTIH